MRLHDECSAAIFTLCSYGAFTSTFRSGMPDQIVAMLPAVPFLKGWQHDCAFRSKLSEALRGLYDLQGECSAILSQLALAPSTVMGWRADSQDIPPVGRKLTAVDGEQRPAYRRDHTFLEWYKPRVIGPAKIRDKWNALPDESRKQICPKCWEKVEIAVVKEGMNKARNELT
jgi:hypothetical protein